MASNYEGMCFSLKKSIIQNQKTFIPVLPFLSFLCHCSPHSALLRFPYITHILLTCKIIWLKNNETNLFGLPKFSLFHYFLAGLL